MRKTTPINDEWYFTAKNTLPLPCVDFEGWETVTLPHTWNADDGQDGGADYFRGECRYYKELWLPSKNKCKKYYLRFGAASYRARVVLNGKELGSHLGGYSAFVFDATEAIRKGMNELLVYVSNAPATDVYPQMADFTFYGGLCREVSLIELEGTHFDVAYYGGSGLTVSATVCQNDAQMHFDSFIIAPENADTVRYTLTDADGQIKLEVYADPSAPRLDVTVRDIRLWQGRDDAYLYKVSAQLLSKNEVVDEVSTEYGFRSFLLDPEKGFMLNGRPYPLRGVSRHQDKLLKGSALSVKDHALDIELINEIGANTVRLAHYQQSDEVYSLCDRYGIVVWAEIPFISKMLGDAAAHENAVSQLKELIVQCYNHPSICFWGISNEITIGGSSESLVANLKDLNGICHKLDPCRLTTMAQVSPLPIDDGQNFITDAVAYNHYFGWYGGELSDNEKWFDNFHLSNPQRPIGISEYGCEGIILYHSDTPKAGDYTEEYQALYHEHVLDVIAKRPYIWGTYVWNMFDFGCDARDEGGVKGRNNKGLVTFDRKIKKDAFYLYKAYWNDPEKTPVVHICGKRYAKRKTESICVKVYSNKPSVSLLVNGEPFADKTGDKVFVFENVPLGSGFTCVSAVAGAIVDTAYFEKVVDLPESYTLENDVEASGVTNWFDGKTLDNVGEMTFDHTRYSVNDTVNEIVLNDAAAKILVNALSSASGMSLKVSMLKIMGEQTPKEMIMSGISRLGSKEKADAVLALINAELQKISKTQNVNRQVTKNKP